jgi:hypothetical protein
MTAARQAAEALFRPKAPEPKPALRTAPPAPDQSGRRPRVLRAVEPARPEQKQGVITPANRETPALPSVPASHMPRIRAWLKYGMTIAQVAQLYGVPIDAIEQSL